MAEKAFAHYRKSANSYGSIEAGSSDEVNRAFGSTAAGKKSFSSYGNATAMAKDIYTRWSKRQAVTVGFAGVKGQEKKDPRCASANDPLVLGHAYTVMSIRRNSKGVVTSIVLRNPWGYDLPNSGSCKYHDSDPHDGLVTVTPAQIFKYAGNVTWGRV